MPTIGVALGSGGAKGLAHIAMLEVLDELDLKPNYVAGTSIGAVIGVLYCSGHAAKDLRELIQELGLGPLPKIEDLASLQQAFRWLDFIEPQFRGKGLLKSQRFVSRLFDSIEAKKFEDLQIPLQIVATDFWKSEQVIFDKGKLEQPLQASMAMPGVFDAVEVDGRALIDGGAVNPVPFDLLPKKCDLTIAINVLGNHNKSADTLPSLSDAVFGAFQIMQRSIIREKRQTNPPDIYIQPDLTGIRVLEFYRAEEIFNQAAPAKEELKKALQKHLPK